MRETVHKQGNLRGTKSRFLDDQSLTYCVWYPLYDQETAKTLELSDDVAETPGLCFDLMGEDLDDLIAILATLKNAVADDILDEEEEEL